MLQININVPVVVQYARKGFDKDGNPWSLVTIRESDNSESKSRSTIKCWGTQLPEGITDGCVVKLTALEGVALAHEKYGERYGKPLFRDQFEVRGAIFELV